MPPLRELAPQPIVFLSSTVTLAPFFFNILAAHKPVYPLPTIAMSVSALGLSEVIILFGLENWSVHKGDFCINLLLILLRLQTCLMFHQ